MKKRKVLKAGETFTPFPVIPSLSIITFFKVFFDDTAVWIAIGFLAAIWIMVFIVKLNVEEVEINEIIDERINSALSPKEPIKESTFREH